MKALAIPQSNFETLNPALPLGIFAGEGELPVHIAKNAHKQGIPLFVYAMDSRNIKLFKQFLPAQQIQPIKPGLLNQNFEYLHAHGVKQAIFAGKVNKWSLLKSPVLDSRAWKLWQTQGQFNDDAIMLSLIHEFEVVEGVTVLPQTLLMQELMAKPGLYSQRSLSEEEENDVNFGFELAKEMARLDVGQTVVVKNGMVLAIEAIEGTDQAILRSGKWQNKKGGVVVKVEKPSQDLRFDIPTVGPRTLKAMRKAGLNVLAVEARKTILMKEAEMIRLANQWQMTLLAR